MCPSCMNNATCHDGWYFVLFVMSAVFYGLYIFFKV